MPDEAIAENTILVRRPWLRIELRSEDRVGIDVENAVSDVPAVALSLLSSFARPRSVGSVLAELRDVSADALAEARETLHLLVDAGALGPPESEAEARHGGYASPRIHLAMLNDRARTDGFCRALRAVVTPDDVVLDIGTGTGILATVAAQAGARHVYAIEASSIAGAAERVFAQNGVADRVTLVRGRSTHVTLPERATVLVTEMLGHDVLDEAILEIVADARHRLLESGARVIPSLLEVLGVPVDATPDLVGSFTAERVAVWRAAYGVDLSTLLGHGAPPPMDLDAGEAAALPRFAPPVSLARIALDASSGTTVSARAETVCEKGAERPGILVAFRATLAPGIVLSTVPGEAAGDSHWRPYLHMGRGASPLARGDRIAVTLRYARGRTDVDLEALPG